jgi:hypothetical protein
MVSCKKSLQLYSLLIMTTYLTTLGSVEILDARIVRASGYGQYKIEIDFILNGKHEKISTHSTDGRLWDDATDEDNDHSAVVMEDAKYTIESAIDNFLAEL